jgi:hypothetical protein
LPATSSRVFFSGQGQVGLLGGKSRSGRLYAGFR